VGSGGSGAATSKNSPPATTQADPDYKIGPQDILRIDVWKELDISRTAAVHPDAKISLALLNEIPPAGLTAMQLAAVITDGLERYIINPKVTVILLEINSRPFR
jgi:polysaccharide export outer membrane protein